MHAHVPYLTFQGLVEHCANFLCPCACFLSSQPNQQRSLLATISMN